MGYPLRLFLNGYPSIKCDSSRNFSLQALSFLVVIVFNQSDRFGNLILSLVLPVPSILAYVFDLPLIWYMVLQDIALLASLVILSILILKYEKRKEETNVENREYKI